MIFFSSTNHIHPQAASSRPKVITYSCPLRDRASKGHPFVKVVHPVQVLDIVAEVMNFSLHISRASVSYSRCGQMEGKLRMNGRSE